ANAAFGFIPNLFRSQTMRTDLIEVEMALVNAILIREGALTRQQKEYIFLVCSAANLRTYCVTAHCEIVRMLKIHGPEPEQVAVDHTHTNLPMRDKAPLNFALKLNGQPKAFGSRDVEGLRPYGFRDGEILEAVAKSAWRSSRTPSRSASARSRISAPWSSLKRSDAVPSPPILTGARLSFGESQATGKPWRPRSRCLRPLAGCRR
ncbi:MAG TPA: peroxidase-related enzyme, partial [Thermoanaerobaculia bacterium]|nr:peroxidase-related enzyme [Thermoanaerobaculia bacterium]